MKILMVKISSKSHKKNDFQRICLRNMVLYEMYRIIKKKRESLQSTCFRSEGYLLISQFFCDEYNLNTDHLMF